MHSRFSVVPYDMVAWYVSDRIGGCHFEFKSYRERKKLEFVKQSSICDPPYAAGCFGGVNKVY
jgi:hypothetical protein